MQVCDSFTDVLRVVSVLCLYDELASCLLGCLMQLVFNTKANLSQPQSLQFVCNQGNHSVVKTTYVFCCLMQLAIHNATNGYCLEQG